MSFREFSLNALLLGVIAFVGSLIYGIEETHHPAMSQKMIEKVFESGGGAGSTETGYGPNVQEEYPHFREHAIFETLATLTPTPSPTPVVIPDPPPLKEALRGRWHFSYAMGGALNEAQWTDNATQQPFKLKPGEMRQIQYGKFLFTLKLVSIDDNEFAATLRTDRVAVEEKQVPDNRLRGPDQEVTYSLLSPANNP
jgi:hypothetical protein